MISPRRKWPVYTMAVGASFTVEKPPKCFHWNMRNRARELGIRLSIRRLQPRDPRSALQVTRVA